jgi:hypothetical protein
MYLDSLIETIWEGVDLNGESVVFSNKDKITFTNTIDALPTADFKAVTIRVTLVTKYGKVVASDSSTIQTTHLTFRYSDTSGMNASYFSVTSDPYSMLFNKFEAMKDGKPVWFFYTDAQCKLEFTDGTNKYMLAESSGIWSAKDTTACKTRVDDIKSKGTTMVDSDSLPTWMHSSQPVNTGLDILNTLTATLIYTGPSALLTGVYVKEVITPKP